VLFIDVLQGMLIGVLASLVFVIYRTSQPHVASLGRVPGAEGVYSDLSRHPGNVPVPGVLIVRPDTQLYYANAQTFRNLVRDMIAQSAPPPRVVIIDASAQGEVDFTTTQMLIELVKKLRTSDIEVSLAEVHTPALAGLDSSGLLEAMGGKNHVFPTVDMAVQAAEARL